MSARRATRETSEGVDREQGAISAVAEFDVESADRLRGVIGKLSRRLRSTVAAAGLTPSQVSVLFTIARVGPVGLSELAEIEAMNPTMVSRIVVTLGELGLITRESRADDRRAATVTATVAGRRLRERVHVERARVLSEYVSELDGDQQALLVAALPALESLAERMRR
jgi:DNA-binding MarR family transcriptional regulator